MNADPLDIMSSIPCPPFHALLGDLVRDHGLDSQRDVRNALALLNVGHRCETVQGGRGVIVYPHDWRRMQSACEAYFNKAYP